jgi:hypothetical protein
MTQRSAFYKATHWIEAWNLPAAETSLWKFEIDSYSSRCVVIGSSRQQAAATGGKTNIQTFVSDLLFPFKTINFMPRQDQAKYSTVTERSVRFRRRTNCRLQKAYTTLHTTLHYIPQYTTLHYTLHYITHYTIALTTLHTTLHYTTVHTTLHYNTYYTTHYTTLYYTTLHYTTLHYTTHYTTLDFTLH